MVCLVFRFWISDSPRHGFRFEDFFSEFFLCYVARLRLCRIAFLSLRPLPGPSPGLKVHNLPFSLPRPGLP